MQTLIAKKKKGAVKERIKTRYRGLCVTCEKAPTCTFPRDPDRPVFQCDEFEGRLNYSKVVVPAARSKKDSTTKGKVSEKFKGLCKICEKRDTCTYPKPEGGVWHCEEYE